MNQFWDHDDICGKAETAYLIRATQEFFELAVMIRRKLGKQDYLLDKYIAFILEGMNKPLLQESAESGFPAFSELRHLCLAVMKDETGCRDHPFYEKVKAHIEADPLCYQEAHTKLNLYCIALAGDFFEYAAKEYAHKLKEMQRAVFDIVYLRDLYRRICFVMDGEEQMEKLNLLLRQRFLIVTPMAGFLQGMTNDLLEDLTERDVETGKQAVRLWLEETKG
jgi:hypothetical protein